MSAGAVSALVQADARLLRRDPLLIWVLLLPFGMALLLRVLVPRIGEALLSEAGFELEPFLPLVMAGYLMMVPGIVGMVVGFLLLDERDARTLTALRTTPLSMRRYLTYRTLLPLLTGSLVTIVCYPLVGLVPLPSWTLVAVAVVAAPTAPLFALVLAGVAPNKVAGFAIVKLVNTVNLLPVAAFFVPLPLQWAAGVLPTYWPMRAFWSAAAGEPFFAYGVVALVVNGLALALVAGLFDRSLRARA